MAKAAKPESKVQNEVRLAASKAGATLFRQNVGQGWIGRSFKATDQQTVHLEPGDVVIRQARPLHAGLVKGSSDLIGWTPVRITPDMVGRLFALFTAIEVKAARGRVRPEQSTFLGNVTEAGGIGIVARCAEDATAALSCSGAIRVPASEKRTRQSLQKT